MNWPSGWEPTAAHWLLLGLTLFSIGIFGVLSRRSAIGVLLSIEILLNAGALTLVALFACLHPGRVEGMLGALFIIAVAAAEVAVAMAVFVTLFKTRHSTDVTHMNSLKG
ncbi:MAG: NADH-quinone oxidoreductase subunit NuoK [Candidatus Delongbacteria bacterium]|nr:NADH-quinone oxidoreductase subunit NuoK [Candidatus Cloacimonadota bacterium]MCB9473961.1 NADH-quinone oxidoreductase subunit NuoK [Candidatus Delongbacteria bacterium]